MTQPLSLSPVSLVVLVGLALTVAVMAQTRPIAFPQGGRNGTNASFGPFGEGCAGQGNEARTHMLIPAEYLPPRPAVVRSLDFIAVGTQGCTGGSTVNYALLEITLAHRPRGAGPLSTTFANNLPTPVPQPVFRVTNNWPRTYTNWSWNGIQFAQGFAYDGVSDIVVEVRKIVNGTGQDVGCLINLNSTRTDLPRRVMATNNNTPNNASSATTGFYRDPLGLRLRFDGVPDPTMEVRGPLASGVHFKNGTTPHFRVFDNENDLYAVAAAFQFLPAAVQIPGVGGAFWLPSPPVVLSTGAIAHNPGEVYQRVPFPLPANPSLAGLPVRAQSVTFDVTTGVADLTNAVDLVIQ